MTNGTLVGFVIQGPVSLLQQWSPDYMALLVQPKVKICKGSVGTRKKARLSIIHLHVSFQEAIR